MVLNSVHFLTVKKKKNNYSGVAQLVEQVAVNHFVGGASPSSGAKISICL